MLRGKEPHQPDFAYDLVRIHSVAIYTHLIDFILAGNTKAPLLHYYPVFSGLKLRDVLTFGQNMKY